MLRRPLTDGSSPRTAAKKAGGEYCGPRASGCDQCRSDICNCDANEVAGNSAPASNDNNYGGQLQYGGFVYGGRRLQWTTYTYGSVDPHCTAVLADGRTAGRATAAAAAAVAATERATAAATGAQPGVTATSGCSGTPRETQTQIAANRAGCR